MTDAGLEPGNLARIVLTTRFIKAFHSATLLFVSSLVKKQSITFSKAQDECAYAKMIEDLTRQVLRSQKTVYLMRLIPSLIHAGFVSQKTKEAILASFERMLNDHVVRERD